MSVSLLYGRLFKHGWSVEEAMTTPPIRTGMAAVEPERRKVIRAKSSNNRPEDMDANGKTWSFAGLQKFYKGYV